MINSILLWISNLILDYLFKKVVAGVNDELKQLSDDKKLNVINDNNVKAYYEAKDRSDRVGAALRILNRS